MERYDTLQLELRLLEDQNVVVRLERHLGRARCWEGEARWAHVAPRRVALEQVRRIKTHPQRRRELALAPLGRHARHLGLVQVRAHRRPAGEQHQVAQRHSFAPRIRPAIVHGPNDRDVVLPAERPHRVDHHRIPVLERERGDGDGEARGPASRERFLPRIGALRLTGRDRSPLPAPLGGGAGG